MKYFEITSTKFVCNIKHMCRFVESGLLICHGRVRGEGLRAVTPINYRQWSRLKFEHIGSAWWTWDTLMTRSSCVLMEKDIPAEPWWREWCHSSSLPVAPAAEKSRPALVGGDH
jgi:hypothetical protein